ncbi:MAG: hypothetical protein ACPLRA_05095 [Candidatus Saccharicenans sp.]
MTPSIKTETIRIFKKEEAFIRYLESLNHSHGYVLVETSPLLKTRSNSVSSSSSAPWPAWRKV